MRSADKFFMVVTHVAKNTLYGKAPVRTEGGRAHVAKIYEQAQAYAAQGVPAHETRQAFFETELPWTVHPVHLMPYAFLHHESSVCVPMDTLNSMSEVDAEFDLRYKDDSEKRLPCYAFDRDFFCKPEYHIFFTNTLVAKEDKTDEFFIPDIAAVPDMQGYNLDTARTPHGFRAMLNFLTQKYGESQRVPFFAEEVPALRGARWTGDDKRPRALAEYDTKGETAQQQVQNKLCDWMFYMTDICELRIQGVPQSVKPMYDPRRPDAEPEPANPGEDD